MVMYQHTLVTVYTNLSENWALRLDLLSLKIVSLVMALFQQMVEQGWKGSTKYARDIGIRELFHLSVLHLSTEAFLFLVVVVVRSQAMFCLCFFFFFQCSLGSSAVEIKGMTNMDTLQTGIPLGLVKWRENFNFAGGTFFK